MDRECHVVILIIKRNISTMLKCVDWYHLKLLNHFLIKNQQILL
jgi:hypothetical protein